MFPEKERKSTNRKSENRHTVFFFTFTYLSPFPSFSRGEPPKTINVSRKKTQACITEKHTETEKKTGCSTRKSNKRHLSKKEFLLEEEELWASFFFLYLGATRGGEMPFACRKEGWRRRRARFLKIKERRGGVGERNFSQIKTRNSLSSFSE